MSGGMTRNVPLASFPHTREPRLAGDVRLLDSDTSLRGNDGVIHPFMRRQRGAGTLMATVFLLLIIALLGGIGLRLASTDINDTALQSDGVEALFLAESGLERTLQRLAAGTACAALVPDAAQTLGRGTFQLQSASLVGGLCRVRVLGSVGLAGATPATRLIEADLSLGGCRGWAVGNTSGGNEVLLCWNGSSWSRSGPYAAIPNVTLNSVTCAAADDCWAVGNVLNSGPAAQRGEVIAHWDGTTWTRILPTGPIPNQTLYGVHCFDADTCWAVGNNRTFLLWDGLTWSNGSTAGGFPNARMNKVFCIADLDCWAVGNATGGNEVIAHWTGGSWIRVGPIAAVPDRNLLGITCTSGADCWAVGTQSTGPSADNINHWVDPNWLHPSPYPLVPNVQLNGVHCSAADNCWAVGNQSGGELIARWNGGPNWTRSTYPSVTNRTLYGIFMSSADEGYAVGANGLIAAWDGNTWANQASPVGSTLLAVTMAPAGGGTVAVQRWREIIQ